MANWIGVHVARRFPELAANPIPGVWFTGSNVWNMLYSIVPSAEAKDWDIFTLDELTAIQLVTGMGWNLLPAFPTRDKRTKDRTPSIDAAKHIPSLSKSIDPAGCGYSDGYCYVTEHGDVDVWVATDGDPVLEVSSYPVESHAHCRAAFSFTAGLIALPNERAKFGAWKCNK